MDVDLVASGILEEDTIPVIDHNNDFSNFEGERCGLCMDIIIDRGSLIAVNTGFVLHVLTTGQQSQTFAHFARVYDTIGSNKVEDESFFRDDDWSIEWKSNTLCSSMVNTARIHILRYLKNPELFDKIGIKPPHGVLLEGPPGCGKTLVAKAIAGEAGVPFYQMAGSELVEVLVGVGSARIRDLFKRGKVNKPSVIFIDAIDALATRHQGIFKESTDHLYNAATQERETTLNQLLIELDGFDTGKGVIFLAATNRRDLLDLALLRAGWTGAKLAQLVLQEAALVAVRKRHESILQSDTDDALDRLWELSMRYENAEVECCDRISIFPRGQVFLGGRAAVEVIYGWDTSKASMELGESNGHTWRTITLEKESKFVGPRLEFERSLYNDYDLIEPPVNFNLDDEIAQSEELLRDMYGRTVSLLRRHHAALLKAVKVLLHQKEISGKEIDFILNKYPPRTPLSLLLNDEKPR
ncbi:hypothetical protein CRYUN_Cryun07bG0139500 [Craigia yunnanensis]